MLLRKSFILAMNPNFIRLMRILGRPVSPFCWPSHQKIGHCDFKILPCFRALTGIVSQPSDKAPKWVPIRSAFGDFMAEIERLNTDNNEVRKVLMFILEENILIRQEQAAIAHLKLAKSNDRFVAPREKNHGMNTRLFTPFKLGPTSEEFLILKARDELIAQAGVTNYQKLCKDVFDIMIFSQWVGSIIGCYLSKYLSTPRYPQLVFMKAAKTSLFKTGEWSEEENEFILKHLIANKGKANRQELQDSLQRSKNDLSSQINWLQEKQTQVNSGKFSLEDDIVMMSFLLNGQKPRTLEEFQKFNSNSKKWTQLSCLLERSQHSLRCHWGGVIVPAILSHFHGTLEVDYRKDFFTYLIESKVDSGSSIDWEQVLKKLPSCTKDNLRGCISTINSPQNVPLYELAAGYLKNLRSPKKSSIDARYAIANVFDELIEVKPLSMGTKKVLSKFGLLQNDPCPKD